VVSADRVLAERIRALANGRMVLIAGLPGTGKSLLVHQLVHVASGAGRQIHLLQWDVARPVFEAGPAGRRYPLADGVTHAVIRRAAGLWVREALADWNDRHQAPEHLLVGEARPRIAVAEHAAVVPARGADRPAVGEVAPERLPGEVLGAPGVLHVLVERHPSGEPLGRDDALGHAVLSF